MLKIVLDTNVFVSGAIKKNSDPGRIIEAWKEAKYILFTTEEIISEIIKVFKYPKIKEKYNIRDKEIDEIIETLNYDSFITPGKKKIVIDIEDRDDIKFLSCAEEARADFLVTGDEPSAFVQYPVVD